jgi:hypothetical protein
MLRRRLCWIAAVFFLFLAGQAARATEPTTCSSPFGSTDDLKPGECSIVVIRACDKPFSHAVTLCRKEDKSLCVKDPNCRPARSEPGVPSDICYPVSLHPSDPQCTLFNPAAPAENNPCTHISYQCPYDGKGQRSGATFEIKWCNPKFADYETCEKRFPPHTRDQRIENGVLKCPSFRCAVDPDRKKWTCYNPSTGILSPLDVGPDTKVDCCTRYPPIDRIPTTADQVPVWLN